MRPYIDCHNHLGRTITRMPPVGQTTPLCLARYAETDVVAAISMPTAVGSPLVHGVADIRRQNEVVARACRDFPQCFPVGLALIEPRFGELGLDEVERALSELGLIGIVTHPPMREEILPFVEVAAARRGLCTLHLHDALMGRLAWLFPETTFMVHAGTFATENLAKYDNLVFEVVQYPDEPGTTWDFARLADKVGSDRIVFGGDLPYYDYRFLQRVLEEAPVSADLKDKIAFRNAAALIRRFRPDWRLPETPPPAPRRYESEELWASDPRRPDRLTVYA